jgi:hypothetical protein
MLDVDKQINNEIDDLKSKFTLLATITSAQGGGQSLPVLCTSG